MERRNDPSSVFFNAPPHPISPQTSSLGVFWGAWAARQPAEFRRHIELLFRWHIEGKLSPSISKSYPLTSAAEALRDLAERRVTGKCVLYTPALEQEEALHSRL